MNQPLFDFSVFLRLSTKRLALLAVSLGIVVDICTSSLAFAKVQPTPIATASTASENRLALVSQLPDDVCHDGSPCNTAIDLIKADGSSRQRLITGRFTPLYLAASPDALSLMYISPSNGSRSIFVVSTLEGNATEIFRGNDLTIESPDWSPVGDSIVYSAEPVRGGNITLRSRLSEIYTTTRDGAVQRRLTDNQADDLNPIWSPNGRQIAFISDRDGYDAVYLMNSDGTDQHRLTDEPVDNDLISWSPDGQAILLTRTIAGKPAIYTFDVIRGIQNQLTTGQASDYSPDWSPDGQQITFTSDRSGNLDIYVMNEGGTNPRPLTNNSADEFGAKWSPDGKLIAFFSKRDGTVEIYSMNGDGSTKKRLTGGGVRMFVWLK